MSSSEESETDLSAASASEEEKKEQRKKGKKKKKNKKKSKKQNRDYSASESGSASESEEEAAPKRKKKKKKKKKKGKKKTKKSNDSAEEGEEGSGSDTSETEVDSKATNDTKLVVYKSSTRERFDFELGDLKKPIPGDTTERRWVSVELEGTNQQGRVYIDATLCTRLPSISSSEKSRIRRLSRDARKRKTYLIGYVKATIKEKTMRDIAERLGIKPPKSTTIKGHNWYRINVASDCKWWVNDSKGHKKRTKIKKSEYKDCMLKGRGQFRFDSWKKESMKERKKRKERKRKQKKRKRKKNKKKKKKKRRDSGSDTSSTEDGSDSFSDSESGSSDSEDENSGFTLSLTMTGFGIKSFNKTKFDPHKVNTAVDTGNFF